MGNEMDRLISRCGCVPNSQYPSNPNTYQRHKNRDIVADEYSEGISKSKSKSKKKRSKRKKKKKRKKEYDLDSSSSLSISISTDSSSLGEINPTPSKKMRRSGINFEWSASGILDTQQLQQNEIYNTNSIIYTSKKEDFSPVDLKPGIEYKQLSDPTPITNPLMIQQQQQQQPIVGITQFSQTYNPPIYRVRQPIRQRIIERPMSDHGGRITKKKSKYHHSSLSYSDYGIIDPISSKSQVAKLVSVTSSEESNEDDSLSNDDKKEIAQAKKKNILKKIGKDSELIKSNNEWTEEAIDNETESIKAEMNKLVNSPKKRVTFLEDGQVPALDLTILDEET